MWGWTCYLSLYLSSPRPLNTHPASVMITRNQLTVPPPLLHVWCMSCFFSLSSSHHTWAASCRPSAAVGWERRKPGNRDRMDRGVDYFLKPVSCLEMYVHPCPHKTECFALTSRIFVLSEGRDPAWRTQRCRRLPHFVFADTRYSFFSFFF